MEIRLVEAEQAWNLRHEVMWPERDLDYVKLEEDPEGYHYGLFEDGRLVSVVSLFVNGKEAQFRKFATLAEYQNKGYGTRLLTHVLQEAERLGAERIRCNARSGKTGFYAKFGLQPTGRTFAKGGKDYAVLERRL